MFSCVSLGKVRSVLLTGIELAQGSLPFPLSLVPGSPYLFRNLGCERKGKLPLQY